MLSSDRINARCLLAVAPATRAAALRGRALLAQPDASAHLRQVEDVRRGGVDIEEHVRLPTPPRKIEELLAVVPRRVVRTRVSTRIPPPPT